MKRIFVIFTILASVSSGYAQNACSNNNSFFTFDNGGRSREIHTLGTSPEFPFLMNLSTSRQVYAAIKKNENSENYKTRMDALNNLMMAIGFTNGIADLQPDNITAANIPSGSEGNMGSSDLNSGYYKLTGDPSGYKAWKVSSPSGCYVYFFARCGNAFYPNPNAGRTACITTPVTVTSDPKEITVGNTPPTMVSDKTYVYYHMRSHRKSDASYAKPGITDDNPSRSLMLSATKRVEAMPQTYKVTVSGPSDNVTICPDSTANVAANINVEEEATYTGNYPNAKQNYKEVSRRAYDRADRKMRKVEKKEAKISSITGVPVDLEQ